MGPTPPLPDAGDPDDVRQRLVITHLQRGRSGADDALAGITRGPWPGKGTDPRAIAWLRHGELVYTGYHVAIMQSYAEALDAIVPRLEEIPEAGGVRRAIDDILRRFRGR